MIPKRANWQIFPQTLANMKAYAPYLIVNIFYYI